VPDPVTNRYRFKLGKGRIRKIGESPYKRSFTAMSFAPRTVV
jgi:arsenite oxidase large subunit